MSSLQKSIPPAIPNARAGQGGPWHRLLARVALRLFAMLALLAGTQVAHAGTAFCHDYPLINGYYVIDGSSPAVTPATLPSSISIDSTDTHACYIENFPISAKWPQGLTSTINFANGTTGLVIFENVYYTGNMACSNTQVKIWFANGAYYAPGNGNACQDLFIPIEALSKRSPGPTATIGVPFTYTITVPVMFDPATGTTYYTPSPNSLSNATIYDDLTAIGASATYVSNTAFLVSNGTRTPIGALVPGASPTTLASLGIPASDTTKHLVFSSDRNNVLRSIPPGTQVEIQMTVVLDDVATNVAGKQFTNAAKWWFGRVIDGVSYAPLPGESGTATPMTIVEPGLTMQKSTSAANLNIGSPAPFRLNVQDTGASDAWNTTITDVLPTGMCAFDPTPTVTARVYAADGVTPVSGVLAAGTDYTVSYASCKLTLNMLTPAAKLAPTQRLIVTYQARLDLGAAQGASFTNVAGATRWYSAATGTVGRREYDRTLTNGTPGVLDFQDAVTLTSATQGYFFLKSVADLTTGTAVASTALPGDRVRYTLQIQNFTFPRLGGITIVDDLDAMNATAAFVPGTLSLASSNLPAGTSLVVNPTGGSKGTGSIRISGLDLLKDQQFQVQFDVTLASTLANNTTVRNQASLTGTDEFGVAWSGVSDDPYVNGPSQLSATGDPTALRVYTPGALAKANTQPTATIGQAFKYRITVPATPVNVPLYDVRILDNLGASAANLSFVSASVVSGGTWTLTNTGTATNLVLQDTTTGIDIPAGGQVVVDVTVVLKDTTTNHAGLTFTNQASYTFDKVNGVGTSRGNGAAATTAPMTIVEPKLSIAKAVAYAAPAGKSATSPAVAGDVLQYTLTLRNGGTSTAWDTSIVDTLPANLQLVAGSATATINGVPVTGFVAQPTVLAGGALAWGARNGDGLLDIPVNGTLVLAFRATVLAANGTPIVNTAYTDWTSLDGGVAGSRNGAGCPSVTAPDTYCAGPASATVASVDPTTFAKSVVSDTWTTAPSTATDATLRVGDTVVYRLVATLREGTTQNLVITDTLPANLAFDGVVAINGDTAAPFTATAPFTYASFAGPTVSGSTVTFAFGNVDNAPDNQAANNRFVIDYRARVVNTITQLPSARTLANSAKLDYAIAGVAAPSRTATATITVRQPVLNVTKTAAPAAGGTVLSAGEVVTYTVDLHNAGNAPAYDALLQDVLPVGMRATAPATVSVTLVNAGTALPALAPTYASATGVATWDFGAVANTYAIPAGDTLRLVYREQADPSLGPGMVLANRAQVQHYWSLDAADANAAWRKDYGATGTATVQLTTAAATALSKQALVTTAAIGQPFTYRITLPATPQPTALHDVRVLDDIGTATTGVSLAWVSASAHLASNARSWPTLSNAGTATSLVLQDTTAGGLDVPAGDQLVVDVVLVLNDDVTVNAAGKQFTNTANYTYDSVDNDPSTRANGAPGASGAITIVAPDLVMTKGGPATMRLGVPGSFRLDVRNVGQATAWNVVLADVLPRVTTAPTGGMCAAAPAIVSARVYQADGTTPVSAPLVNGTDYTAAFAPAPACTLTLTLQGAAAAVAPTQRLIVDYTASLDPGTHSGIALTNVAGATQWRSADPSVPASAGHVHTFQNTLTNGTPGVADFQDAHTLTTESPVLAFRQKVVNATTGQAPGRDAKPGDVLRYTITIQNVSPLDVSGATLTDELDRLDAAALFAPGSLRVVTLPAGVTNASNPNGGAKGTGLLDLGNVAIAPQGAAGDTLTVVYEARLASVITSGSVVLNQAQLASATSPTINSDDPDDANGADNPAVTGDEDPDRTVITSRPAFVVTKTSQDMTGDPAVLRPGDRLHYVLTVRNVGNENATGVSLRDLLPASTAYVAGSTTLDGAAVPDSGGAFPLQAGLQIHAPEDPTPGAMRADASSTTANIATIAFDVTVKAGTLDGTLVCNQGFVDGSGAGSGAFTEVPSDDPRTPATGDPTCDIVGPFPLLSIQKTVAISADVNGNGALDPLDSVRYTITFRNLSGQPATGVVLTDAVPANTAYVADTTTLNGAPVARPDGGVSPLAAGLRVNSPSSPAGTLAPNASAVVTFDVRVNAGVATGTVISNQGHVATVELPEQLTDADGDSSNGFQPTLIVVGSAQQLSLTKSVTVVGGGPALPGSLLEYLVTATNTGAAPVTNLLVTDDLGTAPLGTQVSYVAGSATLDGGTAGVSLVGTQLRADYAGAHGNLKPGASTLLRFRVRIANGLPVGTVITNTAQAAWNSPALTTTASASITIGAIAGTAKLNGKAWRDTSLDKVADAGEPPLTGWTVEVLRNGTLLGSVTTDANGLYTVDNLQPSATPADQFSLRFVAPGAGSQTAKLGKADSIFTNGPQLISGIQAPSGSNLQNLNLPIQPDGVTYDSIVRTPVTGAMLQMTRAGSTVPLPASCFDDPVQQGQVTPVGGFYKFDLNFSDPACPSGAAYLIQVTAPATYAPGVSKAVPPTSSVDTAAFQVATCPGSVADAIPTTTQFCEAQPSDAPPGVAAQAGTPATAYYLNLAFTNTRVPGTSQVYDNHIPIDPRLGNAVTITKVAALQNVTRGQLVPYTITVSNTLPVTLTRMSVVDSFPAGFKYVPKSGRIDGVPVEPVQAGTQLTWGDLQLPTNTKRVIQLMLIVGSGVSEGQYVNRAQVFATQLDTTASNVASATVRVVSDPTFDCTDVIGKVFDDVNMNGQQDEGEKGLPGVRLVTARGLVVTTDAYGRYHLTCADVPDPDRGSNFIVKLDDRSLPTGYRVTTENPLVQRATRGKMVKFDFGAAILRVVTLDLADGVFEPGTTAMRIQWKPRLKLLQEQLRNGRSTLRLSYLAENESESLVKQRLEAIKREITSAWKHDGGPYDLTVETEVFWRTGAPR